MVLALGVRPTAAVVGTVVAISSAVVAALRRRVLELVDLACLRVVLAYSEVELDDSAVLPAHLQVALLALLV